MKIVSDFPKEYTRIVKKTARAVSLRFGLKKYEVSISFVDGEQIRTLNRETRSVDAVTDVLSFPAFHCFPPCEDEMAENYDPETKRYFLGDVVICESVMRAQAEEYAHSLRRECAYLLCHSLLHLLGYDHEQENDKNEMREKEEEILFSIGITRESE